MSISAKAVCDCLGVLKATCHAQSMAGVDVLVRPVLKHGPRSLTCLRVFEHETLRAQRKREMRRVIYLAWHHCPVFHRGG
jgi:hypothetical protein